MTQQTTLNFGLTNGSALGIGVTGQTYTLPSSLSQDLSANYSYLGLVLSGTLHSSLTGGISYSTGRFDLSYPVSVSASYASAVGDGQTV